jgi:hypothetical protein
MLLLIVVIFMMDFSTPFASACSSFDGGKYCRALDESVMLCEFHDEESGVYSLFYIYTLLNESCPPGYSMSAPPQGRYVTTYATYDIPSYHPKYDLSSSNTHVDSFSDYDWENVEWNPDTFNDNDYTVYAPLVYTPPVYDSVYTQPVYDDSVYDYTVYAPLVYTPPVYDSVYTQPVYDDSVYDYTVYAPLVYTPPVYSTGHYNLEY